MKICEPSLCTGCMACLNCCPHDAIKEMQNEHGFYVPGIITEKCVQCHLCQRICPANADELPSVSSKVFACWNTDADVRQCSTSGGMFILLANAILEKGGVVFGVVFDPDSGTVRHLRGESMEDVRAMVGSKYVQSRVGNTFRMVKNELGSGKKVLFTGTPCQCAGLKRFLRGQPENLYLIDIVCHGVPSPTVFKAYLSEITHGLPVKEIRFREKRPSWELFSMNIIFGNHCEYRNDMHTDPFLRLFLENMDLNSCCHSCRYANTSRYGDVTLGDFWGYLSESYALRDNNKGISLTLLNTPKGEALFEQVKDHVIFTAKVIDEAIAGNWPLQSPTTRSEDSDVFWNEFLQKTGFSDLSVLKKPPVRPSIKHRIRLLMDKSFFLMPDSLKKKYRRIKAENAEKKRCNSV